jgi:hypothetical protein
MSAPVRTESACAPETASSKRFATAVLLAAITDRTIGRATPRWVGRYSMKEGEPSKGKPFLATPVPPSPVRCRGRLVSEPGARCMDSCAGRTRFTATFPGRDPSAFQPGQQEHQSEEPKREGRCKKHGSPPRIESRRIYPRGAALLRSKGKDSCRRPVQEDYIGRAFDPSWPLTMTRECHGLMFQPTAT